MYKTVDRKLTIKNGGDKNSSDLVLRRGFTFACDVPKRIRNVVNVGNIEIKEYMYKICFEVVQGIFFCHIFLGLIIVLKRKLVRILKKGLKITFINPNTEEQIVQAMAGVLAYNLAENDDKVIFDYKNSSSYQNSHSIEEEEL